MTFLNDVKNFFLFKLYIQGPFTYLLTAITLLFSNIQVFFLKNIVLLSGFIYLYFSKITIDLNFFLRNFLYLNNTSLVETLINLPNPVYLDFFFWYKWKQFTVITPVISEVFKIVAFCIKSKLSISWNFSYFFKYR